LLFVVLLAGLAAVGEYECVWRGHCRSWSKTVWAGAEPLWSTDGYGLALECRADLRRSTRRVVANFRPKYTTRICYAASCANDRTGFTPCPAIPAVSPLFGLVPLFDLAAPAKPTLTNTSQSSNSSPSASAPSPPNPFPRRPASSSSVSNRDFRDIACFSEYAFTRSTPWPRSPSSGRTWRSCWARRSPCTCKCQFRPARLFASIACLFPRCKCDRWKEQAGNVFENPRQPVIRH
jgi:hypothetical protein